MRQRSITKLHPGLERLEEKQLLSALPSPSPVTSVDPGPATLALQSTETPSGLEVTRTPVDQHPGQIRNRRVALDYQAGGLQALARHPQHPNPVARFTVFRLTNPEPNTSLLIPPFQQVLVQRTQPIPGQVYNVLSLTMRNGTRQTFDANSGFSVKITGQAHSVPVLTGDQTWRPGQVLAFYVLTKQYYPLSPQVSAGFVFDLAGSRGVAIPGPSGIFLRVKYNPATFPNVLNHIISNGPGSKGHLTGIADTSIWQFNRAKP